jgi:hypothetical protein
MIRFLKPLALSCALALTATGAIALFQTPATQAQDASLLEKERRAAGLIDEVLRKARIKDIYAEIRYAVRELYLPYYQSSIPKLEANGVDRRQVENARTFTEFMTYAVTASDELDPVLDERGDEIIADYAAVFARHLSEEQISLIAEFMQTPAARKFGNIIYAYTRLLTGYNISDVQSLNEIVDIVLSLGIEFKDNSFDPDNGPPPSSERVAKAEAIISDFLRISRLDDMVGDIVSFSNNTLLKIDSLSGSERKNIETGLQQFQFYYNLGKSMAVAVAPSALASAADEEQLDKIHRIILTPVFAKSFSLIEDLVREATAFTVLDIKDIKTLSEKGEDLEERSARNRDEMKEELEALGEKWVETLKASLTPETRIGLERTIKKLSQIAKESERQLKKYNNSEETEL